MHVNDSGVRAPNSIGKPHHSGCVLPVSGPAGRLDADSTIAKPFAQRSFVADDKRLERVPIFVDGSSETRDDGSNGGAFSFSRSDYVQNR